MDQQERELKEGGDPADLVIVLTTHVCVTIIIIAGEHRRGERKGKGCGEEGQSLLGGGEFCGIGRSEMGGRRTLAPFPPLSFP